MAFDSHGLAISRIWASGFYSSRETRLAYPSSDLNLRPGQLRRADARSAQQICAAPTNSLPTGAVLRFRRQWGEGTGKP